MATQNRQAAFSLVELMIVISIVAIMAAIAAPSFTSFINQNRLTRVKVMLANDINMARSESIKRGAKVVVCPSNSTATDCSGSNWAVNGWLVCTAGTATNCATPSSASVIVIRPTVTNGITITGSTGAIFTPIGTAASAQTVNLTGATGTTPGSVSAALTGAVSTQ